MSLPVIEEPRCGVAREKIKSLRVQGRDRSQFFYPLDRLRTYLTRDQTTWILQCPCRKCTKHYRIIASGMGRTELIDRIVGPANNAAASHDLSKTAIALFGLLIYIEYPLLVIGFVLRNCCDFLLMRRSPTSFTPEDLRHYCPQLASSDLNEDFDQFSSDFAIHLPHFAVPRMDSGAYEVYERDTVLPFINEKKIGIRVEGGTVREEGAHGRVYAFEIYGEYRDFEHAPEVTRFARKELLSNSELAFTLERTNLNLSETHKDLHIVRMLKSYRHGDTFNIIFPLAKTNLDQLLRNPELGFMDSVKGPVEACSAFKQVLGIAESLEKIGGPRGSSFVFGPRTQTEFRGVHADLKPANILVDDDDNWVISDFGQAVFRDSAEGSSRLVNIGGTDAYAPPEIDNPDNEITRRYDVWSLGCILLEVTTVVILGHDGLRGSATCEGLDQVRFTKAPRSRRLDSRFFCEDGEYMVKDSITIFMQRLQAADRLQGKPTSSIFVDRVLELISKMLTPSAADRIDIGEVIRTLRFAIEDSSDTKQPPEMTRVPGERSILEPDLGSVSLWHWRGERWSQATLRAFADERGNIRTCTVSNQFLSEDHLIRSRVQLVPQYAFTEMFNPHASEEAIYFADVDFSGIQRYTGSIFSFSDIKDAVLLQEKFTAQKVEADFPLSNIKYRRHKSNPFRRHEDENNFVDLGSGRVQLWTEVGDPTTANPNAREPLQSPIRPPRLQPHQRSDYRTVAPTRLVIFFHRTRTIMTVLIGKNWHNEQGEVDPLSRILRFVPRAANRDPSFVTSILETRHPDKPESFPGIPLDRKVLRAEEQKTEFECDLLELTLLRAEMRTLLSRTFTELRDEWKDSMKILEHTPGYSPVEPPVHRNNTSGHRTRLSNNTNSSSSSGSGSGSGSSGSGTGLQRIFSGLAFGGSGSGLPRSWRRPPPHRGGERTGTRSSSWAMNGVSPE